MYLLVPLVDEDRGAGSTEDRRLPADANARTVSFYIRPKPYDVLVGCNWS